MRTVCDFLPPNTDRAQHTQTHAVQIKHHAASYKS